jgi:LPS O-antigen subunit length determinant protein (WzzB/FepE family)
MQQTPVEQNYYQEDEIDLKQLFRSLADRNRFIFGFTGFITVLAIAYALSIAPTYKATTSFLSPNESSVIQLNRIKLTSETSETIYRKFLNKVMSSQFQRKIFDENAYLSKLNPDNKPIKNLEDFFAEFSKNINLETNKIQKNVEQLNYEKPVNISIEGNDATVIASFLNDLTSSADTQTVNEFLTIIQQKIDIRLDEISKQRGLLLLKAKQDRFSKIAQIQEQDLQKTNEINDQIGRLRIKSKKDNLNKIKILTDSSMIAKSL